MNNRIKRFLSVLVAVLLLFSVLPLSTFASGNTTDITATVRPKRKITVVPPHNGKIVVLAPVRVYDGDSVKFTMTPDDNYVLYGAYCNGKDVTTNIVGDTYTHIVNSDVVFSAEFIAQFSCTVTFYGTQISPQIVDPGEKVIRPGPDPARSGYVFGGWYKDEGCTQAWNFGSNIVMDNMILYPKWIKNTAASSIVVGVVDQNGVPVSEANVELRLGVKKIAANVTDEYGYYRFDNVEIGTYDVVATKAGKVKTALVKVIDVAEYQANINLPNGEVNSKVEFEGDEIPESRSEINSTVVGGLDDIAISYIPEAAADNRITIKLMVEPKDDTGTEAQTSIKRLAGDGAKVEFLDMSLWKQINDNAPDNIGGTNNQLLTIVIPFDFTGIDVNTVMVLRHHGSSEKLPKNPANGKEGFTVDVNAGTITVYAKRFSDYALGYKLGSASPDSGSGFLVDGVYNITVNSTRNGNVEINKKKVYAGEEIVVKLKPDKGFASGGITVFDKAGNKVEANSLGGGKYRFTMPAIDVTVNASFTFVSSVHDCPRDITCPIDPFGDTLNDYWWHDGIHYCIEHGLMIGYGNDIFGPNNDTTRAMMTTILWRLSGSPKSNYNYTFKDVPKGEWYTEAVKWAKENGVVLGYDEESFGPNDVITREQMMTIFCRYYAFRGNPLLIDYDITRFKDTSNVSSWAFEGVKWSVNNCVIQGDGDNLNPKASCTRAQAANIVQRFCEMFGFLNK